MNTPSPPTSSTNDQLEIQEDRESSESSKTEINEKLFNYAMHCEWELVVELYKSKPYARTAKITRFEDTILHLAVMEDATEAVYKLVNAITNDEAETVISAKNDSGNTPLHIAAALGNEVICQLLASRCPNVVVKVRNKKSQTPLFVAVEYNRKKVFLMMHYLIANAVKPTKGQILSYCRSGDDGNTILHRAIFGEYFDLAYQILNIYPDLVNQYNARGESALHILAGKPAAFRSGSNIRFIDPLIYAGVFVEPLVFKYQTTKRCMIMQQTKQYEEPKQKLPDNYKSCLTLYSIVTNVFKHSRREDNNIPVKVITEDQIEPENYVKKSFWPPIYKTGYHFSKFFIKLLLVILGIGIRRIEKIKRKKQKLTYASQVMKELIKRKSFYKYDEDGRKPLDHFEDSKQLDAESLPDKPPINGQDDKKPKIHAPSGEGGKAENTNEGEKKDNTGNETAKNNPTTGTPILLATKSGIIEMVKAILDTFPIAAQDLDADHKNIILLAVEYRQTSIYRYMTERKTMKQSVFSAVDKEGNSALHLAAKLPDSLPWAISGAALEVHWEIKWYKFIKSSMPPSFFANHNNEGKTAREIFSKTHGDLVKGGGDWMNKTSQACSVVAALVATVAFASATTVPGGLNQTSGYPILAGQPAFNIFAVSALAALCFSVTSLVVFLAILTSRYLESDFAKSLPFSLVIGLSSLFMSIVAMLVSFCGGHFYVLEDRLKYGAYPVYVVTLLPVTLFALAQFPLYYDLIKALAVAVPERAYKRGQAI